MPLRASAIAAAIALLPLLPGCAQPGGPAPATATAAAAAPSPAAVPAGPASTRFDGRYTGESNLTLSRGNLCGAQAGRRSVTVQNGQARMVYDVSRGMSAAGPVQADGSVTMRNESEMNTTVAGRFENGRFQGELRSGQCVRSLDLRRARG